MRFPALAALFFFSVLASVAFAYASSQCEGASKTLTAEEREKFKPYILDSAPADIPHTLDVNFDNKVHLIGYDFRPESARPGQQVKLTYWWRCDVAVGDDWLLFTHTKAEGKSEGNLDYDGPLREQRDTHQVLGPDRWEKGKIYVDQQTYTVPNDFAGLEVTVVVGVWKGYDRLHILSGPHFADNSAIVGKIKIVDGAKSGEEREDSRVSVPKMTLQQQVPPGR